MLRSTLSQEDICLTGWHSPTLPVQTMAYDARLMLGHAGGKVQWYVVGQVKQLKIFCCICLLERYTQKMV